MDQAGGVTVARLLDRTLTSQMPILRVTDELSHLADQQEPPNLLLDLSAVELVSSLMLGKLISLNKQCGADGGKLVLCSLSPRVRDVIAVTKLTRVFTIAGNEAEGLASF